MTMSVTSIVGPIASGKTTTLVRRLNQEVEDGRDVWLVGTETYAADYQFLYGLSPRVHCYEPGPTDRAEMHNGVKWLAKAPEGSVLAVDYCTYPNKATLALLTQPIAGRDLICAFCAEENLTRQLYDRVYSQTPYTYQVEVLHYPATEDHGSV